MKVLQIFGDAKWFGPAMNNCSVPQLWLVRSEYPASKVVVEATHQWRSRRLSEIVKQMKDFGKRRSGRDSVSKLLEVTHLRPIVLFLCEGLED